MLDVVNLVICSSVRDFLSTFTVNTERRNFGKILSATSVYVLDKFLISFSR